MNHINPSETYLQQAGFKKAPETENTALTNKQKTDAKKSIPKGDVIVNLSDTSREMQIAKQASTSSPDIREQKIKDIQTLINENRYEIKPDEIAGKILGLHIDETI